MAVEFFLANQCQNVVLPEGFSFCPETQSQILVGEGTMFSDVVFLDAINLGRENEKGIAIAKDGAWIGLLKINTHFVVAADEDLAGLGRGISYDGGVFDVLDIGGEGMKVLGGLVQHGQNAFEGPTGSGLRGESVRQASRAANNHESEQEKSQSFQAWPQSTKDGAASVSTRNRNIHKEMREQAARVLKKTIGHGQNGGEW
jgi:hypothetical protein